MPILDSIDFSNLTNYIYIYVYIYIFEFYAFYQFYNQSWRFCFIFLKPILAVSFTDFIKLYRTNFTNSAHFTNFVQFYPF
jgi:hypothetical protein